MATEPTSKLVIRATLAQLGALEQWLAKLAVQSALPASLVQRIDVCLTELLTNLICYGYPDAEAGTVSICAWCEPDRILVRIDDDGTPFDPTAYLPPELPTSLDEAAPGGRGIRLVRHFADGLQHLAGPDGNRVTLQFRGPGAGVEWPACRR